MGMGDGDNKFDPESIEFLQGPWLMRLATISSDGFPHVTPVWYVYEDGRIFTSTEKDRVKFRNIARDNKIGASIDWEPRPYRGLSIKGIAHVHEQQIKDRIRQISGRYVPADEVDDIVDWLLKGPRVVLQIEPVSVVKVGAGWRVG
jgi:PPOX class probable F420-dependent enzyme